MGGGNSVCVAMACVDGCLEGSGSRLSGCGGDRLGGGDVDGGS